MERKLLIVLCIITTILEICGALQVNPVQVSNIRPQVTTSRSIAGGNVLQIPEQVHTGSPHNERKKRALIFRPLFVYRQQEIKKQKRKEMRQQQQQQTAQTNKHKAPMPVRFYAQCYPYQHSK
uniref:Uncharacterized protein n=2 Tax=Anopheles albimanus TaxID=7167 RepID=A0A182FY37_ANOAL